MKEALFYTKTENRAVECNLCPHNCKIPLGQAGRCKVRVNREGVLYSLVYGRPCAVHVDPIEKKPLFHFLPGSLSYSLATVGCNLSCVFCQNHEISQVSGEIYGFEKTPSEIVDDAVRNRCESISYTYTEPTIFLEYAIDCMKIAHEKGLYNVFVSNGFTNSAPIDSLEGLLDAVNIDLKSFSDDFYRENCGASINPVLDSIKHYRDIGVWVEVTTLVIPGLNDSLEELSSISDFIAGIDEGIPWHVSRFHPDYKMLETDITNPDVLRKAVQIGYESGLKHVYTGNIKHDDNENTKCPSCGRIVIERSGFHIIMNHLNNGRCGFCENILDGVYISK